MIFVALKISCPVNKDDDDKYLSPNYSQKSPQVIFWYSLSKDPIDLRSLFLQYVVR